MKYRTLKGMSDIFLPEIGQWLYIEEKARCFFGSRLYEEIRTPIVEYTELFQRSIGEASDIVNKEMYTFDDRGGRSLTMRPEMTASVIRAVIENNILGQREPLKLYYNGPMFRAERPQAGRKRQFYQCGVEVIGNDTPFCDVEVIRDLVFFLMSLGFTADDITIKLNNVGCTVCRASFIDILRDFFKDKLNLFCENCNFKFKKNVLRIFDCKNPKCKKITESAPKITDHVCEQCSTHFDQVIQGLKGYDMQFVIDKSIVRGLDYYTSTVFEVTSSKLGAQDAIAAGGRYNNLMKELGGPDKGAIGFAIGIERLLLCLEDVLKKYTSPVLDNSIYVAYASVAYIAQAQDVIACLEKNGYATYADCDGRSLNSQMKRANKFGFRWALILNEGEYENGNVTLKDLRDAEGKQYTLDVNTIQNTITEYIAVGG